MTFFKPLMKLNSIIITTLLLSPLRAAEVTRARYLMGTLCEITAEAPGPGALDAAFLEIARLEALLSTFIKESEVSALNRAPGRWVSVSRDTWEIFAASRRLSRETRGAFDPTYASTPGSGGMEKIGFDPAARRIRLPDGGRVDFGGIGKGYALDAAAGALKARGVERALLDFGGQILLFSPPGSDGRRPIRIAAPEKMRSPARTIFLKAGSISTSGAYEQPGHIIRPGGGRPLGGGSVSVIAPTATDADAWSTALFAAGIRSLPAHSPLCAIELKKAASGIKTNFRGACAPYTETPGG